MEQPYQLSKYARVVNQGEYTALFNGLTLKKAYGRTEMVMPVLKELEEGDGHSNTSDYSRGVDYSRTINSLTEHGFVVHPSDDDARLRSIQERVGNVAISNLVMIVANDCNLRCTYCQIEEVMENAQRKDAFGRPLNMSREVAKNALDLYEVNSAMAAKRTISITGGEPFMNPDVVKYILERAREMGNARTVIFTNGVLITEELAAALADSGAFLLVSFDGPKYVHDSLRKKIGGQGSFDDALRGYQRLKAAGCTVGISAVTGTHNQDQLEEVLDFFIGLEAPSLGLNYGHHLLEEGKPNPAIIKMDRFVQILTTAYTRMRQRGKFLENISRFVGPFYLEQPRVNECQAQGKGFTVDSRGLVGVCKSLLVSDRIAIPLHDIDGPIAEIPVFREWAHRSPFTLEECVEKECTVMGICGGGCTYDSYAINQGNIQSVDPRACTLAEGVVDFLLWDLFEGLNIKEKVNSEGTGRLYVPTLDEQKAYFTGSFDSQNQLQRSVGHEKDH